MGFSLWHIMAYEWIIFVWMRCNFVGIVKFKRKAGHLYEMPNEMTDAKKQQQRLLHIIHTYNTHEIKLAYVTNEFRKIGPHSEEAKKKNHNKYFRKIVTIRTVNKSLFAFVVIVVCIHCCCCRHTQKTVAWPVCSTLRWLSHYMARLMCALIISHEIIQLLIVRCVVAILRKTWPDWFITFKFRIEMKESRRPTRCCCCCFFGFRSANLWLIKRKET